MVSVAREELYRIGNGGKRWGAISMLPNYLEKKSVGARLDAQNKINTSNRRNHVKGVTRREKEHGEERRDCFPL
jgi:hypothetical protein